MKILGIFKVIIISLLLFIIGYFLVYLYIKSSYEEAAEEHFKNWKENEFYPSTYHAIVYEYKDDYLKMKKLHSSNYINEDYLCKFRPSLKKGDTIFKNENSYDIYLVKDSRKLLLEYDFCNGSR